LLFLLWFIPNRGRNDMRDVISAFALAAALWLTGVASALAQVEAAEAALERGDYGAALHLYQTEAEAGDQRAQVALGFMFWCGEEQYGPAVHADAERSFEWFARAAAQGNAVAISMLSVLFKEGQAITAQPIPAVSPARIR